jgi:hypothetical protein
VSIWNITAVSAFFWEMSSPISLVSSIATKGDQVATVVDHGDVHRLPDGCGLGLASLDDRLSLREGDGAAHDGFLLEDADRGLGRRGEQLLDLVVQTTAAPRLAAWPRGRCPLRRSL